MITSRRSVEAYYYGKPEFIGAKILFIKRDERLPAYRPYLTGVHEFGNVWQGITGTLGGQQISIISTGIGPGLVGDAVYALDRAEVTCLYSGTCGGIHESLKIGDYFVADQAVCGDGYSWHSGYSPHPVISGSPELLEALRHLLAAKVDRVDHGASFTTSSVVREADEDFWETVDKSSRIIEMAAAAFYSAALATGKRAAAYFWVSDLPTRGKSFFEPLDPPDVRIKQTRYDRSVSLDIELLASL